MGGTKPILMNVAGNHNFPGKRSVTRERQGKSNDGQCTTSYHSVHLTASERTIGNNGILVICLELTLDGVGCFSFQKSQKDKDQNGKNRSLNELINANLDQIGSR